MTISTEFVTVVACHKPSVPAIQKAKITSPSNMPKPLPLQLHGPVYADIMPARKPHRPADLNSTSSADEFVDAVTSQAQEVECNGSPARPGVPPPDCNRSPTRRGVPPPDSNKSLTRSSVPPPDSNRSPARPGVPPPDYNRSPATPSVPPPDYKPPPPDYNRSPARPSVPPPDYKPPPPYLNVLANPPVAPQACQQANRCADRNQLTSFLWLGRRLAAKLFHMYIPQV